MHVVNLIEIFFWTKGSISIKLDTKHSGVKGNQDIDRFKKIWEGQSLMKKNWKHVHINDYLMNFK